MKKGSMGSKQASTDSSKRKIVSGGTTVRLPAPRNMKANNSRGGK